jgi:DNA mismatch repair ATPase MutS
MIILLQAVLVFVIVLFGYNYYRNTQQKKKLLADIKEKWGLPIDRKTNFSLIGRYLAANPGGSDLSEATADDLDLKSVFQYIDRTGSKPGQQYLYKALHSISTQPQHFALLEEKIEYLKENEDLRRQIQIKLAKLNNDDAYYVSDLFGQQHAPLFNPYVETYIKVSVFLVVPLAVLLFFIPNQVYFLIFLAALLANIVIHYITKNKIFSYVHSLPQLLVMYDVGSWMIRTDDAFKNEVVTGSLAKLSKLKKSLGLINYQNKTANDPTDITYLLAEWIKIFLLSEPRTFISSIKKINKYADEIKILYEYVAEIDMAISIQSVRDGLPYYSIPDIAAGNEMIVKGLYHPLVKNCVANSITSSNGQGVLITGSNMSGKTTFIRAMAINALLSQTIHTSLTTSYQAPPLNILTSIDMSDNMEENRSYFQAEALSILNIMEQSAIDNPVKSLIIIDEIFRGTNTIERIAAAKAVLTHLIRNKNFVFVSTHDLELAKLLGDDYAVFSFEELMGDNRLVFDYKIKAGLLKNKNGIAVLQGLGYPPGVIDDAYKVSKELREKYEL